MIDELSCWDPITQGLNGKLQNNFKASQPCFSNKAEL